MNHIIYVTGNDLKFKVAVQALENSGISLERVSLDVPEIQNTSVEEIAKWSAIWACQNLNQPVVVMDVGYYIEALNGFPGPFIKYVNEWFTAEDFLNLMAGKSDRHIVIRDCLAYCSPDKKPTVFSQLHQGEIATIPGSQNGSPIDRIFIPDGYKVPISALPSEEVIAYWSTAAIWLEFKAHILSVNSLG